MTQRPALSDPASNYALTMRCILLLLFAILGFLLYSNTLSVPFYLDDHRNIVENHHIRLSSLDFEGLKGAAFESPIASRPAANLSFAFNYFLHGYDLRGYHILNITIHVLTGVFLFLLIQTTLSVPLLRARYQNHFLIAFFAALLWLVNPIHIQSVTYVVQRMNSMAAMFFVLSLLLYAKGRLTENKYRYWVWFPGSILAGIVAICSKEIATILPLFVLLYEWYFFQDVSRFWLKKNLQLLVAAFLAFAAIVLIFTWPNPIEAILSGYEFRDFSLTERLFTEFRVLIFYIGLFLFPHPSRLNLEHDFILSKSIIDPISTLASIAAVIIMIGLAFHYCKKQRLVSFAIIWFLGNLAIESTVIPLEIIFEHRSYMPTMFFSVVIVLMIFRLAGSRGLALIFLGLAVVFSSLWTYERNNAWREPITFFEDAVMKSPEKARVHNNLGVVYRDEGLLDFASASTNTALRLKPDFVNAYVNLGNIYLDKGLYDQAISQYRKALGLKSDYAEVYTNLGNVYMLKGMTDEAISAFNETLRLKPDDVRAMVNLGSAYSMIGMTSEAIKEFEKSLLYAHDNPDIYYNLGLAYIDVGNAPKAVEMFKKTLDLNPEDYQALEKLTELLAKEKAES